MLRYLPPRNSLIVMLALGLGAALLFLPAPPALSRQGHVLLALSASMLVLWVSQATDFSASSFFLLAGMALGCGLSPAPPPFAPAAAGAVAEAAATLAGPPLGAVEGVRLAMRGFATPAWILVAAALFIAAGVEYSGLGRRISLLLLKAMGVSARRIRAGAIALPLALSLLIPSPAANAGLCTVLMIGVMRRLNLPPRGNLSKGLFLTVTFAPIFSTMMVLTAGGGPVQTAAFILQGAGRDLTWLEYALYGAPLCLSLCLVLFVLLEKLFPVGGERLEASLLSRALEECGPPNRREKGMAVILAVTIPLWITAKALHPVDPATVALAAVAAMFCPGVLEKAGAPAWKELADKVAWGTLMLFGAVISLGQALLESGAASWLARSTLVELGMADWPLWGIILAGGAAFAVFGLGFSARSAAIGALTPTIIGFAASLPPERRIPVWGLTLVLNYAVQFSVLFPANSPMAMIAYTSNTFTTRDMMRLSLLLMPAALLLMLLFAYTWWPWLGVL